MEDNKGVWEMARKVGKRHAHTYNSLRKTMEDKVWVKVSQILLRASMLGNEMILLASGMLSKGC